MHSAGSSRAISVLFAMYFLAGPPLAQTARAPSRGGKLVVGQEAEPKTLNPLFALDDPSKEVIGRLTADLISIDRQTQTAKPALAEWCHVSLDGLHYTIRLRSGLRFSDGHPFDADDVVFSLQVSLDEKVHAMQRDLLIIHGKPLSVVKMDAHTVRFDLPAVYGPGERLFDSVPMLPRHLLERAYQEGKLSEMWGLDTKPEEMAGMGPFRVKNIAPASICYWSEIHIIGNRLCPIWMNWNSCSLETKGADRKIHSGRFRFAQSCECAECGLAQESRIRCARFGSWS